MCPNSGTQQALGPLIHLEPFPLLREGKWKRERGRHTERSRTRGRLRQRDIGIERQRWPKCWFKTWKHEDSSGDNIWKA